MHNAPLIVHFNQDVAPDKHLFGGKGAGLIAMTHLGVPVPPGFVLSTDIYRKYRDNNCELPEDILQGLQTSIKYLEKQTGADFGDAHNPLIISIRSGSPVSMPGIMETVLNLGFTSENIMSVSSMPASLKLSIYLRYLYSFSQIVLKEDEKKLGANLHKVSTIESALESARVLFSRYSLDLIDNLSLQLKLVIEAVFDSWMNERAVIYRKEFGISEDLGTAAVIQKMVFGNFDSNSGTGVVFSRNPIDGSKNIFGEFIDNAQGEELVSGERNATPIDYLRSINSNVYSDIERYAGILEKHFRDMQDIEFTVEKGILWILQTRSGKRTQLAAFQIARNLYEEGLISQLEAVEYIDWEKVSGIVTSEIDYSSAKPVLGEGMGASPGIVTGVLAFSAQDVSMLREKGVNIVLVLQEASPRDIGTILQCQALVTITGGLTAHAAVVARGRDLPCIVGCHNLKINSELTAVECATVRIERGQLVTVDGNKGKLLKGEIVPETIDNNDAIIYIMKLLSQLSKYQWYRKPSFYTSNSLIGNELVYGEFQYHDHIIYETMSLNDVLDLFLSEGKNITVTVIEKIASAVYSYYNNIINNSPVKHYMISLNSTPLDQFILLPEELDTLVKTDSVHAVPFLIERTKNQDVSKSRISELFTFLNSNDADLIARPTVCSEAFVVAQMRGLLRSISEAKRLSALIILVPEVHSVAEYTKVISNVKDNAEFGDELELVRWGILVNSEECLMALNQFFPLCDIVVFDIDALLLRGLELQPTYALREEYIKNIIVKHTIEYRVNNPSAVFGIIWSSTAHNVLVLCKTIGVEIVVSNTNEIPSSIAQEILSESNTHLKDRQ